MLAKYALRHLPNKLLFFFSEAIQKSTNLNPYTGQLASEKAYITNQDMFVKVTQASQSQKKWREIDFGQRAEIVRNITNSILSDIHILKPIIANQIGKSYQNIDEEFRRLHRLANALIDSGKECLKPHIIESNEQRVKKIVFEPVGLALIFPYFSEPIFDSLINLIPCLISGNGALIKGSDYNHFLGPYLQRKVQQITKLESLVADVFIQPEQLKELSEFRSIKKVIYSGTQIQAKKIFETIVQTRLIDCNLFFGGQDAAYVDQLVDMDLAVKQITKYAFYNNGQSYDCIKRLYVHENIADQLYSRLREQISHITFGDPQNSLTYLGPLCSQAIVPEVQRLINDSVSSGSVCEIGGLTTTDGVHSEAVFFEPTLIRECSNDMPIIQTQLNAPILCAISVKSKEEFGVLVNDNVYGTGIRIFTKQEDSFLNLIEELNVGRISFNSGTIFNKNLPIEGWMRSGKGKLLSALAYEQFTIPKSYNFQRL